jgi:hypothetical protein
LPPSAIRVWEYGTPIVPPGKVGAVLMVKPAAMLSVNALLAVMDAVGDLHR